MEIKGSEGFKKGNKRKKDETSNAKADPETILAVGRGRSVAHDASVTQHGIQYTSGKRPPPPRHTPPHSTQTNPIPLPCVT